MYLVNQVNLVASHTGCVLHVIHQVASFLNTCSRGCIDFNQVDETTLTLDDLAAADEVFLTGNFSKVQPVVQVGDTDYQIGPVATRARELYFEFASREGAKKI